MAEASLNRHSSDSGETMERAKETIDKAKAAGRRAFEEGYENAREYAERGMEYVGGFSDTVSEFVARDPWVAVAGAFLIGYVAAQLIRRVAR